MGKTLNLRCDRRRYFVPYESLNNAKTIARKQNYVLNSKLTMQVYRHYLWHFSLLGLNLFNLCLQIYLYCSTIPLKRLPLVLIKRKTSRPDHYQHVGNKAKEWISSDVSRKQSTPNFLKKRTFFTPWVCVSGVKRCLFFSEKLACFVFLKQPYSEVCKISNICEKG